MADAATAHGVCLLHFGLIGRLAAVPVAYLVLWLASLGLSITLVVLLRSRWGQSRPLHRCAVLSLLVHLMLAWAAMTVRIVAGDGDGNGGGMGPSIRVHVIEDAIEGPMLAVAGPESPPLELAPPLLDVPPEKIETPPPEDVQAEEVKPVEAPASAAANNLPDVESRPAVESVEVPPAVEASKLVDVAADAAPTPEVKAARRDLPAEAVEPGASTEAASAAVAPTMVSAQIPTAPQATTPYSLRDAPGRLGLVEQQGGSGRTESAVSQALRWLAGAQSRDGRWDADEYGAGQEQMVLNQNRGGAGRNADTGVSALALLAFLGAGHSHLHGDYQDTVRRGIDFLLRSQAADGSLFGESTLYAQMYCHSMATFALAEALAMTGDRRLEPAVTRAVNFSIAAQNTSIGGWRYRPGDSGDTSQLGWQIMALASARRAGINVPGNTWARVERFLTTVRRGARGGLASYRPDGPASTSMTAEALYCRLLLAEIRGDKIEESAMREASDNLLASPPTAERVNLYYWYYATLALHFRHTQNGSAAEAWKTWNDAMTAAIVATQVAEGRDAGSWSANTVWGGYGGRIYTTAMAAMCLEIYYRYAPMPSPRSRWTATRPGEARTKE
jgi:hypothetical protein